MFTWVFDFDGVLANTMAPLVNFLSANLGVSKKRAALWITGYSMSNKPNKLLKNFRKAQSLRFAKYLDTLDKQPLKVQGVIDLISSLPGKKFVMTSNYDGICNIVLGNSIGLFEDVVSFDDVPSKTAGLDYLIQKHSIDIHKTIYITDTIGDILEFRLSQIPDQHIYAVNWGYHSHGLLLNYLEDTQILKSHDEILTILAKLDNL